MLTASTITDGLTVLVKRTWRESITLPRMSRAATSALRAQLSLSEDTRATIEILDYIDPDWGCNAVALRDELKQHPNLEEITVVIHSRGGNAMEGFAMYNLLVTNKAKVSVEIIGIAASAASVVAMAGDDIRIAPAGYLMIHNPWMFAAGDAPTLRRFADMLDKYQPSIVKAYLRKVGKKKITQEQLQEWMADGGGDGTWFDAEAAVANGFADRIMDSAPAPQNSIRLDGLKNVPEQVLAAFGTPPPADTAPDKEAAGALLEEVIAALKTAPVAEEPVTSQADLEAILAAIGNPGET